MASRNYNTVLIADHIVLNGPDYTSSRTPREIVESMGGIFVEGPLDPNKAYPAGKTIYSYQPDLKPEQITEAVGDGQFNGVIVAAKEVRPKPGQKKVDGEPYVSFAVRIGAGTNNVAFVSDPEAGGVIMNTPGFNSKVTADAIVSALNQVLSPDPLKESETFSPTDMVRQTREVMERTNYAADSNNLTGNNHGGWPEFTGTKSGPKRICVIGASGHIGGEAAKKLIAEGHDVMGVSRNPEEAKKKNPSVKEWKSLLDAAEGVDVIVIQTPEDESTKKLLTEEVMRRAKPGVIIVNAARAGVVDTVALKKLAQEGHIGGIIVDVDHFTTKASPMEPYIEVAEILQAQGKKALVTPHTFADTHSPSREAGAMQAIRQAFRAIHKMIAGFAEPYINQVFNKQEQEERKDWKNGLPKVEDGCKPETLHPAIAAATGQGGLSSRPAAEVVSRNVS